METHNLENYTYDNYLNINKTTPDEERYELIFGNVYAMSGASATHQDIVGNIFYVSKSKKEKGMLSVHISI